jgi:hypothetical protein
MKNYKCLIVFLCLIFCSCAMAQQSNYRYNILEISLKDKSASVEISNYIEEIFKKELASMDEENGVPQVYIYEERDGVTSYYIGFVMHSYEVKSRPPNFYTRLNNQIVLLHTSRISYLNKENVNWDSLFPLIKDKLYDEPTWSYHPEIWLIKTKDGVLLEKRVLEYFDFRDQ